MLSRIQFLIGRGIRLRGGLCGAAVMACCILSVGCINHRYAYTPLVRDYGPQIVTKHKYNVKLLMKLRSFSGAERLDDYDIMTKAVKSQPGVFSQSGLPIEVRGNRLPSKTEMPYQGLLIVPALASFCSFSMLPLPISKEPYYDYEIRFDESSEVVSLKTRGHEHGVVSWSPLALLCPISDFSPKANERSFTWSEYGVASNEAYRKQAELSDEALIYGTAVRLKELEDSGAVDATIARRAVKKKAAEEQKRAAEAKAVEMRAQMEAEAAVRRAEIEAAERRRLAQVETKKAMQKIQTEQANKPPYRIIDLAREKDSDFAYAFTLELSGDASIQTFFGIQAMFANEVRAAYQMEYPKADAASLRVVVKPRLSNGKIVGRAEVLTITPTSLTYDANTCRGKLSVRFNANQYEAARAWVRRNIETLARDKNIALVTGEIPPDARFYSLGESLKDGSILEIEFKTE